MVKTIRPQRIATVQPVRTRKLDSGRVAYDRRWRELSAAFAERYPFCILCLCYGQVNECGPLIVDHIVPHHGNTQLFWDQDNWQTLGKGCHDRDKQGCERASMDWFAMLQRIVDEKDTREHINDHRQWIPLNVYGRLLPSIGGGQTLARFGR